MGYSTVFEGQFSLNRALDDETYELLNGLASTRRVKRNPLVLEEQGYGKADSFGTEGEFFYEVDEQNRACSSIVDNNHPPATQPGLWLQWVPTDDRRYIRWDFQEKFYESDKWIIYLIDEILTPRGFVLNGEINCQGEDDEDQWSITIRDNHCRFSKRFNSLAPVPDYERWFEERLERKKAVLKQIMGEEEFEKLRKRIEEPIKIGGDSHGL